MTQQHEKQTAKQAYDAAKTDIATLMGWLESELDWMASEITTNKEEINWGQVGSLQKVRSDLLETLSFISGHDIDGLKEGLEESRM